MIHIAFDSRMVHHSGIGTHIRGLTEAMVLQSAGSGQFQFTFMGDPNALRRYPHFVDGGSLAHVTMPIYGIREQLMFPRVHGADAYHFPHYNVPFGLRRPFFVTIHDLIHVLFPEFVESRPRRWLGRHVLLRAARNAMAVFTVSDHTRRDICDILGIAPERIVVTPNAVSETFRPVTTRELAAQKELMRLPDHFLLAIGVNKPHKNLLFLVKTFCEWKRRNASDMYLVLCGPKPSDDMALRRAAEACGCAAQLVIVPYTDYSSMPALIQSADALIFPSLYEGFGLPVLEAQRVGTPVVASNAASIPEVAGDAALYFDPREPDALMAQLDQLTRDAALRTALRERGFANEKRYRWEESATKTLQTYSLCLGGTS